MTANVKVRLRLAGTWAFTQQEAAKPISIGLKQGSAVSGIEKPCPVVHECILEFHMNSQDIAEELLLNSPTGLNKSTMIGLTRVEVCPIQDCDRQQHSEHPGSLEGPGYEEFICVPNNC